MHIPPYGHRYAGRSGTIQLRILVQLCAVSDQVSPQFKRKQASAMALIVPADAKRITIGRIELVVQVVP